MPSKAVERFRVIGLYNTYGLLARFSDKGQDVACVYHVPERWGIRCTRVCSPSHETDPKAAWYDHGMKSFSGKRDESVPLAVAWATERYGITEWAVCPLDRTAMIPAVVRKRALAAIARAVAVADEGEKEKR